MLPWHHASLHGAQQRRSGSTHLPPGQAPPGTNPPPHLTAPHLLPANTTPSCRHATQIQDATFRSKRKGAPHVIARIRKSHTSKLATQYLTNLRTELASTPERAGTVLNNPEFVIPNDIVSALLTQVRAWQGAGRRTSVPTRCFSALQCGVVQRSTV
jgi:hypothetical protein